jgi:hypothetical protein
MYTHFAYGFVEDGRLDSRFRHLMTRLAKKNGWFVPVGQLLDYLLTIKGPHILTAGERRRLELRWSLDRYMDRHFPGRRAGSGGNSAAWSESRSRVP